jgi:hypothetical protein
VDHHYCIVDQKMMRSVHFIDIPGCVLKLRVTTLNSILISATKNLCKCLYDYFHFEHSANGQSIIAENCIYVFNTFLTGGDMWNQIINLKHSVVNQPHMCKFLGFHSITI